MSSASADAPLARCDDLGDRPVVRPADGPAAARAGIEAFMPHVAGAIGRRACESGDASRRMLSAGQSLGLTNRRAPLAAIVDEIEREALRALARLRAVSATGRDVAGCHEATSP